MESEPTATSILARKANIPDHLASSIFRSVKFPIIVVEKEYEEDKNGYQAAQ